MQLLFRTTTGKTITLKVGGSDTFDLVKAKIKYIAHECTSLDNCSCLPSVFTKEANINDSLDDEERENLSPNLRIVGWPGSKDMPVSVRIFDRKTITLAVHPYDTICDLMCMITEREGIAWYWQSLFLAGMSLEEKDKTLLDYNIDGGSTLDLLLVGAVREIFVETTDGKKIPLAFRGPLFIKEVKELLIQQATGAGIGIIPLEQQRLIYAGEELQDDRILQTYYIQDKATLRLVDDAFIKKKVRMRIHIQIAATHKIIHLDVESTNTIHAVKAKIQAQEDIPTAQQVLFLPHKRLNEDAFTLADCLIQKDSTLYLAQVHGDKVTTAPTAVVYWMDDNDE